MGSKRLVSFRNGEQSRVTVSLLLLVIGPKRAYLMQSLAYSGSWPGFLYFTNDPTTGPIIYWWRQKASGPCRRRKTFKNRARYSSYIFFIHIYVYCTYIRKMLLFLCENLIWFLQEFDLTLFRANQIFSTNFVQFFRTNLRKQKIQQRKI